MNKILLITAFNDEQALKEYKSVLEPYVSSGFVIIYPLNSQKPVEHEIKKRPKAVLIDGCLRSFEKEYYRIMSTIHSCDIPLLLDLYCFRRNMNLPGLQFVGAQPTDLDLFLVKKTP